MTIRLGLDDIGWLVSSAVISGLPPELESLKNFITEKTSPQEFDKYYEALDKNTDLATLAYALKSSILHENYLLIQHLLGKKDIKTILSIGFDLGIELLNLHHNDIEIRKNSFLILRTLLIAYRIFECPNEPSYGPFDSLLNKTAMLFNDLGMRMIFLKYSHIRLPKQLVAPEKHALQALAQKTLDEAAQLPQTLHNHTHSYFSLLSSDLIGLLQEYFQFQAIFSEIEKWRL